MRRLLVRSCLFCVCFLTLFGGSSQAITTTIGKLESGQLRILAVESGGGLSFALRSDQRLQPSDAHIIELQNPHRLVVDLPASPQAQAKTLSLSHPLVKALRIGVHAEKTRLVIDLAEDGPVTHSLNEVTAIGALLLHLSPRRPVSTATPDPQRRSAPAVPVHDSSHVPSAARPVARLTATPATPTFVVPAPEARAQLAPTGAFVNSRGVIVHRGEADEEEAAVAQRSARVTSLQFEQGAKGSLDSLVVGIEEFGGFALTPLADGEYELRFRDAALATEIPGQMGVGFAAITASDDNADTIVLIRVNPGVVVAAEHSPGALVLRATRE